MVVPHCEPSVILGLKFLKKHKFIVDFGKNELSLPPLSPEPLKMMVVAWSEDESRSYQRSTDNSRESVETEHSRWAPSTQHSRVFESRDPRWDSEEKPPPGRWDAMIVDSEADFRMVSTTASDYRCDGSRCPIVTTMKPHQKTLFGNVASDELLGNLKYEEIEGDLFSSKDCLAHCVSADFHMGTGLAKQVKTRYATTYPKDIDHKTQPLFAQWIEQERRYVYHLVTKQRYFEKPTYESVKTSLQQMRIHAEWSGVKRISLPRIGCGLDQLNWSEIRSLIKDVFKGGHVTFTVHAAPQQNPTLNCETDLEEVESRRGERPSPTPSSSGYIDEWFDRNQQSELGKFRSDGCGLSDSRGARMQDCGQSSAQRLSRMSLDRTNVRR